MKKIIFLLFVIVFFSCSPDSSENNDSVIPSNEKLIHKIDNGETAVFIYEGDKIVKGIGNTGYNAFQVEYENNKVKRVYSVDAFFPKPFDFSFDLSSGVFQNVKVMDYNYSNNKLLYKEFRINV
jgi:hypothetical protein